MTGDEMCREEDRQLEAKTAQAVGEEKDIIKWKNGEKKKKKKMGRDTGRV